MNQSQNVCLRFVSHGRSCPKALLHNRSQSEWHHSAKKRLYKFVHIVFRRHLWRCNAVDRRWFDRQRRRARHRQHFDEEMRNQRHAKRKRVAHRIALIAQQLAAKVRNYEQAVGRTDVAQIEAMSHRHGGVVQRRHVVGNQRQFSWPHNATSRYAASKLVRIEPVDAQTPPTARN